MLMNCMQATCTTDTNRFISGYTELNSEGEWINNTNWTDHEVDISLLTAEVVHQSLKAMLLLTYLQ